jgi:hypothetical protein
MMKKITYLVAFCSISWTILSCAKDPVPRPRVNERNFLIETHNPVVDAIGAIYHATVYEISNSEVAVSHGFLWGKNPSPDFSEFIFGSDFSNINTPVEGELTSYFSARVRTDLKPGEIYHVRNYVITAKDTIMGNIVAFESTGSAKPFIHSVVPNSGIEGDTITISGIHFALDKRIMYVRFNDVYATVLPELGEPNELMIKIPSTSFKGKVNLVLEIYEKDDVFDDFTIL